MISRPKNTRLRKIYRACEFLETGDQVHSCIALAYADGASWPCHSPLANQYGEFYERYCGIAWPVNDKDQRIIMLLLFAEVGLEGVRE